MRLNDHYLQHREFDEDGLARYGEELEDEPDDWQAAADVAAGPPGGGRPARDTVAFDSDLDMSD